jgi:hypothetical protein
MSSTTGSQNLLVNVFRPVYRYEIPTGGTTAMFTPKLEISNVDNVSATSLTVFTAAVGDTFGNAYVGSNAGNAYEFRNFCCNVTALGVRAGNAISNVSNSVYLGFSAGAGAAGASSVIAIGANATGNGTSNIYIGTATGAAGVNNIFIGHGIAPGTTSNTLRVGGLLYGDLSSNRLGVGLTPSYNLDVSGNSRISSRLGIGMNPTTSNALDVSGYTYVYGGLGINADPADYTLNLNGNFFASEGGDTFSFSANADGIVASSVGYTSVRGNVSMTGAATVGTVKKGVILVSMLSTTNSANYASRMLMAYTTSNVVDIGSNIAAGTASIDLFGSNIRINESSGSGIPILYSYSVTYFPLP